MNTVGISIRPATENDAKALLEIYKPYVEGTAVTFEYTTPSVSDFARRIKSTLQKYPYLVAENGNEILGYAYAGTFKGRSAYDYSVETTVYVRADSIKSGIGARLYDELERILKIQGILNVNACVAYSETEDEYLTHGSVIFHQKSGYRTIGHFHKCGYKFDRWYDMVWLEKHIGKHTSKQSPIVWYSDLEKA